MPWRLKCRLACTEKIGEALSQSITSAANTSITRCCVSTYSRCRILVNDHWPSMRECGFLSNRLFDAAAAGAFVLSDQIDGGAEVFGEDLVTYQSESDFQEKVRYYLARPAERCVRAERMQSRVLAAHTFAHRAKELMARIKDLDRQKRSAAELVALSSGSTSLRSPLPVQFPASFSISSEGGDTDAPLILQSQRDNASSQPPDLDRLTISIKTSVPNTQEAPAWGDHHFALALQRAFNRLGHSCRIDMNPEWGRESDSGDDVTLTLRGRHRYKPNPRHLNLMWNISHPDRVAPGEYEDFDHVFVASHSFAQELAVRLGANVSALLQCTDPEVFYFERRTDLQVDPLLFVGNSRKVFRPIVRDAIAAGLPLAVYGSLWEDFLQPDHLKGLHIDNNVLRHYYSGCKILFNDHWETMAKSGFLSNRLFDAGACGAFIVSDQAAGMDEVFDGCVQTYRTQAELREIVEYYLLHDDERLRKGEALRSKVSGQHTFDRRARQIIHTISRLVNKNARGSAQATKVRRGSAQGGTAAVRRPERIKLDITGKWSSKTVRYSFNHPAVWLNNVSEVHIRGWCFPAIGKALGVRLRHGGAIYEGTYGLERLDVAKAFPDRNEALQSGFEITARMPFFRNQIAFELKDESGAWVPFHVRSISSWRAWLRPILAAQEWIVQFDARDRTLWHAQRQSPFHRIIREELAATLDATFWSALRASESHICDGTPAGERDEPLVSIIMPTYNRAELIQEAMSSVLTQSWRNWELHVCDDGSEDDTESVVTAVGDSRIKFHKLVHGGAAAARNQGLARASGRFIAYLDTDNIWHPDYLLTMVGQLMARPDRFSVYCRYLDTKVDGKGRYRLATYRDVPFDYQRLSSKNFVDLNGFAHRIELYRELGGFTESLVRLQDWDLVVRYSFYGDPLYVDQFLVVYRRNSNWGQLTVLHEHRSGPRLIVKGNIDRLYATEAKLSTALPAQRDLNVKVVVHAKAIRTPSFAPMVRALARYCKLRMTIFGGSSLDSFAGMFPGVEVSLGDENRAQGQEASTDVLLYMGCDDFTVRLVRELQGRIEAAIVVDNANRTLAANERWEASPARYQIVRPWDPGESGGFRLNPVWDERIVRQDLAERSKNAHLSLWLDDYELTEAEAHEIRRNIEGLPGRQMRVVLLSTVLSLQEVLDNSTLPYPPSVPPADAYLFWRGESERSGYSALPMALAMKIPVLSNQIFDRLDPEPARFSRHVSWNDFGEVRSQVEALTQDVATATRLTAHGLKIFMRNFGARTLGQALAIYCRIAAADWTRRAVRSVLEEGPTRDVSSESVRYSARDRGCGALTRYGLRQRRIRSSRLRRRSSASRDRALRCKAHRAGGGTPVAQCRGRPSSRNFVASRPASCGRRLLRWGE